MQAILKQNVPGCDPVVYASMFEVTNWMGYAWEDVSPFRSEIWSEVSRWYYDRNMRRAMKIRVHIRGVYYKSSIFEVDQAFEDFVKEVMDKKGIIADKSKAIKVNEDPLLFSQPRKSTFTKEEKLAGKSSKIKKAVAEQTEAEQVEVSEYG